jgi:hypothetical protein
MPRLADKVRRIRTLSEPQSHSRIKRLTVLAASSDFLLVLKSDINLVP